MDFDAAFDGIDDLIADMHALADDAEREIEEAVKETTAVAYRLISMDTPVGQTGDARRQWSMGFPSRLVGEVFTNSKILWFLEWGTGLFTDADDGKHAKYKIAPKNKKALAFQGGGGSPYQMRQGDSVSWSSGTTFNGKGQAFSAKGQPLFRSKAGNATVNQANAAGMLVRRFVMHPGIKPVGMVRGNLPKIRAEFDASIRAAGDRLIQRLARGT